MSASWISKKLFETKKKKLKTNISKKRFSFMLTEILKNSKIIESLIFVYEKQFIMILIYLMNQRENCFKKVSENWFEMYVIFRNFDWIIRTSKKLVKSSCIKRLNRTIFTNEQWIKSIERKTKTIRFFLQSSNEKSNCCKNHRILLRQLQLQIRNQLLSKKNQSIASVAHQRQHQIVQNLKNQFAKNINIIFQQLQNVRQHLNIQHQSLFHWFKKNIRNLKFSSTKQSIFTNLSSADQSIIDISINNQQKHREHVFSNTQLTILLQNQFTNQIQSI